MPMPDFNNTNRAIYLQIADELADRILAGQLLPEARIPSVREYAVNVGVNVNTVVRAYDQLAADGIIYNKRGLGYFVAPGARDTVAGIRRSEFVEGGTIDNFFRQLNMLGIGPAELADMYTQYLNR